MPSGDGSRVPAEKRIAACADYLLGVEWWKIKKKHGVSHTSVVLWIRKTGHFKLRR